MTTLNLNSYQINKNNKKVTYIEGIRGLAAFMVVIYHYLLAFYPAHANGRLEEVHLNLLEILYFKSPFLFLTNGQLFVLIFFILSGYVLSKKFMLDKDMDYLASAFIRRLPRLYIPVAVSLIISYIILVLSLDYNSDASIITKSTWLESLKGDKLFITFLKNILISAMFLGNNSYNTVLWSITIEFYGSILVFGSLALIYKSRNSVFILLFILFILLFHEKYEYSAFILGILLNYSDYIKFKNKNLNKLSIIFTFFFGLLLGGFPHVYHTSTPTISGTFFEFLNYNFIIERSGLINEIGAFLVIFSIQKWAVMREFFSGRFFLYLGKISFSMYLIHVLILKSFSSYLFIYLQRIFSYNWSFLFQCIPSFLLIIVISHMMTNYVDEKSILLSKLFYKKYFLNDNSVLSKK
ncbi:acyltransferase family protein [Spirosoma endophyticum]|uniref:Peptidoglycan/LPS O-acetylase OafA/YrhL, contains acyltransferase and SGNH-hydrolase domains n=1 Tax=Spirosoma endophyticum TaxID=662367 RepID=A0A1I2FSM7_9BACT|nr:acyltransferase [Spirosoma endophyticum]SFF07879.1 Peptidoglycan/LPS O-acetylase OafA/YrhL, contains acyltransferase and SGNH-hydrolase domains [Spirosoma endophyticum]